MTWSIGLHLGEAILEIVGRPNGDKDATPTKARSFTAQTPPAQAFSQFIAQNNITQVSRIDFVSHLPIQIIEAGYGNPAAILTTSGFENWIEMCVPLRTNYFTARPRRPSLLIDREFVFGVGERTNAQGHIEKIIPESELEFLITKLELHKLKHVAICFLHSQANNENEKRAAEYLTERGYHVYTSSQAASSCILDERVRFWTAVLNAYVAPYFLERLNSLHAEFEKVLAADGHIFFDDRPFADVLSGKIQPLETTFSFANRLSNNFAKTSSLLYCGLEEFLYFQANPARAETYKIPLCEVAAPHLEFKKIEPQPLTQLGRGFFSELTFSHKKIALDPGPIVFGRGLTPSLFDILTLNSTAVDELSGIKDRLNERGRQRLTESLTAYARSMSDSRRLITASNLAEQLLQQAKASWKCHLEESPQSAHLKLCGPLAPTMQKMIGGEVIGDDFFTTSALLLRGHSI